MCSEEVLSRRSSLRRSMRSLRSWRLAFSDWWWPISSSRARMIIVWCSEIFVETGSVMCSRVARCLRKEAQVVVRSMGSSRDLICERVSEMVLLVWSMWPLVERISPSSRRRICWCSLTRSCSARSVLAAASSAAFWQRAITALHSSRSTLACSSRVAAAWLRRTAPCCLASSFRLLSLTDASPALGVRMATPVLKPGEECGRTRSMIDCMLRCVVRRHVSSTPTAWFLWSRSCSTSVSLPSSSEIMFLVRFLASLSRTCVSWSTAFSDSSVTSVLSRTCSRKGRRSRCSMRQRQCCICGSLSRCAASICARECCECWMEPRTESALFCSMSMRR
mmetsp:Transcript_88294/g.267759  ORF Transcript_88294/g.267759 Transcript_88294/m.267759 type:complete len:335 (-) Transcript_88294:241-1245(-)